MFSTKILPSDFPDLNEAKRKAQTLSDKIIDKFFCFFQSDEYVDYINEKENILNLFAAQANEIQKFFNLPIQYRNIEAITGITKIILDGKADDWKEAVNLFDT